MKKSETSSFYTYGLLALLSGLTLAYVYTFGVSRPPFLRVVTSKEGSDWLGI